MILAMKTLFIIIILFLSLHAKEPLVFGVTATVEHELMKERLQPLLDYLHVKTGHTYEFATGYDYKDTIDKFADGTFDLGYIGPAPYIKTLQQNPHSVRIVAGIKNRHADDYCSVIITKKGAPMRTLDALAGKRFAFGSPHSTLSYYVPMQMLHEKGIDTRLHKIDFLGRHDRVAQYVIMGRYDAGAVKHSVAQKYKAYVDVIAKSVSLHDFIVVVASHMDEDFTTQLQQALYEIDDVNVTRAIKPSAIGFEHRKDSDYDSLRAIMQQVHSYD